MNLVSRRRMLAATAAAGLGLLSTTAVVNAQSGPFRSSPGDGGYGRQAFEPPPGRLRSAQARVVSRADVSFCTQRWAYYDPASGMSMDDDGEWRPCP
jgi:hypothetical protein